MVCIWCLSDNIFFVRWLEIQVNDRKRATQQELHTRNTLIDSVLTLRLILTLISFQSILGFFTLPHLPFCGSGICRYLRSGPVRARRSSRYPRRSCYFWYKSYGSTGVKSFGQSKLCLIKLTSYANLCAGHDILYANFDSHLPWTRSIICQVDRSHKFYPQATIKLVCELVCLD
jgi:hypothetical protein